MSLILRSPIGGSGISFPLQSAGRYLTDQHGVPRLLIGSSPQGILVTRSVANFTTYCSIAAGHGINCIQVHVVAGPSFGGGTNYETYDSVHPFTVDGDVATPNNTYFSRLDSLLTIANSYGICVMLTVGETIDAKTLWTSNGNTKCYDYGRYLGLRYRPYRNVIWNTGNDFQDWATNADARNALLAIYSGIRSADPSHTLYTAWLDYEQSSTRDSTDFDAVCPLDFYYTYYVSYWIEDEYALNPAKPPVLGETYYQDFDHMLGYGCPPLIIRQQNYWALCRGAAGIFVNNVNWQVGDPDWQSDITNKECFIQAGYAKWLWESYAWNLLVPDVANSILVAGEGTKGTRTTIGDASTYATTTAASDGSAIFTYLPAARSITLAMGGLRGPARSRWFDPTNKTFTADENNLANSGTHQFTHPGNNSAGASDWVHVVEA